MPPYLTDLTFPDKWWDAHLIRDADGQVLPIGTLDAQGQPIRGEIVSGEYPIPADLEARKKFIRGLVFSQLRPIVRSVPDPSHGPPPKALTDGIEDAEVVEGE